MSHRSASVRSNLLSPDEIPRGWAVAKLDEIAILVNGYAFTPRQWADDGLPIIRIQNLNNAAASYNYFDGELPARFRVKRGDLLFAWSGTPGTSFGAHIWRGGDAWLNQHIFRIEFDRDLVDAEYFCAAINFNLESYISQAKGGSGLSHVKKSVLTSSPVLIAPLNEQRRIVQEIESIRRDIDIGEQALATARNSLKQYTVSVLQSAVTGNLTTDWRTKRSGASLATEVPRGAPTRSAHAESVACNQMELLADSFPGTDSSSRDDYSEGEPPALPPTWVWAAIAEVGEVRVGRQRSSKRPRGATMRPYLRVANVFEDRIDVADVLEMPFTAAEIETYQLKEGDVLLNEGQSIELVGRPAIYRNELPGACFQNTLIRFRAFSSIEPAFALLVFRFYLHSRRFQRAAKRTTNIAHLSAGRFSVIEFPVPPLEEQRQIIAEANAKLSHVTESEHTIREGLSRCRTLRRMVLRRAFEGRLTDQNPADEPANELMLRIQASMARRMAERSRNRRDRNQGATTVTPRPKRGLMEVLEAHPEGMTPEDLFKAAGYHLAEVDEFYAHLARIAHRVEEHRPASKLKKRWPSGADIVLKPKKD